MEGVQKAEIYVADIVVGLILLCGYVVEGCVVLKAHRLYCLSVFLA